MRPKCSVPDRSMPSVVTLPTLVRIGLPPMMEVITGVGLIASRRSLKSTWYRSIWPSKAVSGPRSSSWLLPRPVSSVTYETGPRSSHELDLGPLTAFDGQIDLYHVDFKDRLLAISPTPVITSIIGGNPILTNVGSVTTDGIDLSGTLHFGRMFSFYDALSYNHSKYDDNYSNGTAIVPTAGKEEPGSPEWMNKFVATATIANTEFQLIGDYVGKRYATYTDDLSVSSYFLMSLGVSGKLPFLNGTLVKNARYRFNVTNLANRMGALNVVVGAASGTYNTYPIPPRQGFLTFMADF